MKNRCSYFGWKRIAKRLAQEEGKLLCPEQKNNIKATFTPPPLKQIKYRTDRKLKYILIAVIFALLSLITLSVTAWRDYSIKLLMNMDGKTGIINNLNGGLYLPTEIQVPTYFPPGFVCVNVVPMSKGGIISFENAVGDTLSLTQRDLDTTIVIDTENSEVYEDRQVAGEKAILTIKRDGSSQALYWNTPDYSYELVSTISIEEMLKIAESIPQK